MMERLKRLLAWIVRLPISVVRGLVGLVRRLFTRAFWKQVWSGIFAFVVIWLWQTVTFSILLLCYLCHGMVRRLFTLPIIPSFISNRVLRITNGVYERILRFSTRQERTINRVNLIDLSIKNMLFKRSRAFITVGGMAIGIGAIVFLVSLGFGLQELVVSRVARLDELKQADVSTQPGSKEVVTDKTLAVFQEIDGVDKTLPLIAIVARVEFQNSVSDMAVFGVTADYLAQSAVQPVQGKLFDSNELSTVQPGARVAGATTAIGAYEAGSYDLTPDVELPIEFTITPDTMIKVRSGASRSATVLGYTRRGIGKQQGFRTWGELYPEAADKTLDTEDQQYGPWIKADFPLWQKQPCTGEAPACLDGQYTLLQNEQGEQSVASGYAALVNVQVDTLLAPEDPMGKVLGDSTDEELLAQASAEETSADAPATDELTPADTTDAVADDIVVDENGWVEIASESAIAAQEQTVKVSLGQGAKRVAVVNRAMLQILNLPEQEAIGKTFRSSFVVVGDLLNKPGEKVESIPEEYQIIGVVPEDKVPFFYVPFVDLRLLGITQYSQLKVTVSDPKKLPDVRKKIEANGFSTRSVADTVKQIDRLFSTARIVLAILGFVALSIAALGMFNTLTVSLLERTREVGLMKAMGMRSNEVRELFLTESLVMGFFGGVLGILLGSLAGESIGVLLSLLSVTKGIGYVDVAYLPPSFVTFIFVLSLLVGVFTGVYPARRATRISALDALRYE